MMEGIENTGQQHGHQVDRMRREDCFFLGIGGGVGGLKGGWVLPIEELRGGPRGTEHGFQK